MNPTFTSPAMTTHSDPHARQRLDALSTVFAPRSVAIVGASDTTTKIAGIPVDYH